MRCTSDCIGIVVVPIRRFHKVEYILMNIAKSVFCVVWTSLDFVPHDAVSESPALFVDEFDCHSPRNPKKVLLFIWISNIEPERSRWFNDALEFSANGGKFVDELDIVLFKSDSTVIVFPLPSIWRACHDHVERFIRNVTKDVQSITKHEKRGNPAACKVMFQACTYFFWCCDHSW